MQEIESIIFFNTNAFELFIMQNYRTITYMVMFLAFFAGIISYNKFKGSKGRYFIWFLLYLAIIEVMGSYVHYLDDFEILKPIIGTPFDWNYWWFNVFWEVGAIVFFAFYYSKILKTTINRQVVKYGGLAFFFFSIVIISNNLDKFFTGFLPMIRILGAVVILLCSVLYFMEILQSDKILIFYKSINFYISVAIFIWWLILTPLVFYDIYNYNGDADYRLILRQIYLFANIFMYLTFTFALLWCRPEND